jgi:hypothetical protein
MRRLLILAIILGVPAQIWAEGSYYGVGTAATSGDPNNTVDRSKVRKNAKAAPRFISASGAPTGNNPLDPKLISSSGAPVPGTPGNPLGSNTAPNAATPNSNGGVVPSSSFGGGSTGGGGGFGLGNGASGFGKFSGGSSTGSGTSAPKCAQGQQLVGTQCVGLAGNSPSGAAGALGGASGYGGGGGGAPTPPPPANGIPNVPH